MFIKKIRGVSINLFEKLAVKVVLAVQSVSKVSFLLEILIISYMIFFYLKTNNKFCKKCGKCGFP